MFDGSRLRGTVWGVVAVLVGAWGATASGQSELEKLTAAGASAEDQFGFSLSISGDLMLVGAIRGGPTRFSNTGAAYVFLRDGARWTQRARLLPDGGDRLGEAGGSTGEDRFGVSVCIDGDTAIVGASREGVRGRHSGSAYVFQRGSTGDGPADGWRRVARLTAADAAAGDMFGFAVGLDGRYAVVGAYGDDDAGAESGAAYVFEREGGRWLQRRKLVCDAPAVGYWFGRSVAVDGDTVVIGASGDGGGRAGRTESGAAYVYRRRSGGWIREARLTPSGGSAGDRFGRSVAVSGNRIIVGAFWEDAAAPADDGTSAGRDTGAAYVFEREGGAWTQRARLTAVNGATEDLFGISVGISGGYAVVGAMQNDEKGPDAGSAYFFKRTEGGRWTQPFHVTGSDAAANDWFGFSVAIDGIYAAVGSIRDDDHGFDSGSVDVYSVVTLNPGD